MEEKNDKFAIEAIKYQNKLHDNFIEYISKFIGQENVVDDLFLMEMKTWTKITTTQPNNLKKNYKDAFSEIAQNMTYSAICVTRQPTCNNPYEQPLMQQYPRPPPLYRSSNTR